ncbi:MAG: DNA polymerase III subunit gamma/tau [bacterium]|nr:DNA polymerase III subunit gamma/tau [bacterium]
MNYLVLARKYRPQLFNEIIGQEIVAQALQNAITSGKIGHAYLFSGPRGVGKTTAARIFAKALNCQKGPTVEPDNTCQLCKEITEGNALDVLEIDGASNRGIDEIRALRENVKFAPAVARYKIYIIDEVHQVTEAGFNALLKTLEEPPSHVIFIFATTEPQMIPETILSRCQRFNFKLISATVIEKHLKTLAAKEKIIVSDEALDIISQAAQGSMRDAQSTLDQVISFVGTGQQIDGKTVRSILGITSQELLLRFSGAIFAQESKDILALINEAQEQGLDLYQLTKDLHGHFRNLIMAKISAQPQELIKLPVEAIDDLKAQVAPRPEEALLHYIDLLGTLEREMKYTDQPKIVLEMGLLRIARPYISIEELVTRLEAIENSNGGNNAAGKQPPVKKSPLVNTEPAPGYKTTPENASLKQQWQMVLEEVRKKKPGLAASMEQAKVKDLIGTTLTLEFSSQDKFQKQTIERAENAKVIEMLARQVFQKPIKISSLTSNIDILPAELTGEEGVTVEEEVEEPVVNDAGPQAPIAATAQVEGDPVVRRVLDIFGGEIINNNVRKGE